jgi:hypothetical protein
MLKNGLKLTPEHYHEMTDRLHVVSCIINDHLIQHPVNKLDKEVSQPIEKALELLYEAYQISGKKLFESNEK